MYLIADGGICSLNISNTMDAIMLTKNLRYIDGVKLDVRMSLDNVLVLSEYNNLDKYTFSKKMITDVSYDYLKKVKFRSHIFKYYIPTLDEVLRKYNKNKIIILEIYNDKRISFLMEKLLEITGKYVYKYYFYSKDKDVLLKYKELVLSDKDLEQSFIISKNPLSVLHNFDK